MSNLYLCIFRIGHTDIRGRSLQGEKQFRLVRAECALDAEDKITNTSIPQDTNSGIYYVEDFEAHPVVE